ncbi:MAG TPA: BatD family protein [Myxococcales bacterium]
MLLVPSGAGAADVEFYAVPDSETIGVDDTLLLTVTVGVDIGNSEETEDLKLPEAPDFEVLSRSQRQQKSFSMVNGGPPTFRSVRVFTMLLQPRRTGTLTIQPGKLVYQGKTYETGAIRIKVTQGSKKTQPAPTPAPPANNPFGAGAQNPFGALGGILGGMGADDPDTAEAMEQLFGGGSRPASDSDLYLRAVLDRKQAYLGEQVTYAVYLFSRVDISGVDGFKMSKLDGFWAEDLETPTQISGELKMIDGVPYRVFLLRKRALFPIKSGKLSIEPVEVEVTTGMGFMPGRKVKRGSQSLALEVLPLPPGAPPAFETPNVGQWRLSADAAPTTTALNQPVTLKVTLEGAGNLHDVVSPKLPPIPGLRAYDPTINEKTSTNQKITPPTDRRLFGGKRVLEYLMMPEQTGTFEIPALTLQYFDPSTKEYKAASTQPIQVRVDTGAGTGPSGAGTGPTVTGPSAPRAVNVLDQGAVRALRYKGDLAKPSRPLYKRPFFLPIAATPLALWLVLAAVGLARTTFRPSAEGIQRGLAGKARRRLKGARAQLKAKNPDGFYAEINHALNDYLSARLGTPVKGLTRQDLSARLTAAGLAEAHVRHLALVLDTCDAGRFAPGGSDPATLERVLSQATSIMATVDGAKLTPAPTAEPHEVTP